MKWRKYTYTALRGSKVIDVGFVHACGSPSSTAEELLAELLGDFCAPLRVEVARGKETARASSLTGGTHE